MSVVISGHSHTVVDTRVGNALVIQASSYTRAFDQVHLLLDKPAGTIAYTWASIVPTWKNTTPLTYDPAAPAVHPYRAVQQIVDAAVQQDEPDHAAGDQPRVDGHPVTARGRGDAGGGVAGG